MESGLSIKDLQSGTIEANFERFFRSYYHNEILKVIHGYPETKSLVVDFNDLDKYDITLADELVNNPDATLAAAENALRNIEIPLDTPNARINVRFANLPASHKIMIRDLRSEDVGKFIVLEGLVRKATDVRPKLVLGVFACPYCGHEMSLPQDGDKLNEPFICEECEKRAQFNLNVSKSTFIDAQKILVQEPLEDLRGGEHPKQMSIFLEDDLTGKIMPGDRVELAGVLRAAKKIQKGIRSRVFEIFIEANSYTPVELDYEDVEITKEDEKEIKKLAGDPMMYEKIRDSIAPHIYGYKEIKEAIMYQLFSAPMMQLPDGGRIRGDSHIILIGEPATGKCISGDTVLCLANGDLIEVKELVDSAFEKNMIHETEDGRLYSELTEPLFVPSMNDSLKIESRSVTHVWKRKYAGRILKIMTQSGKSIRVTPEHPFFVVRGGRVTSIPAEELSLKERIATLSEALMCDGGESNASASVQALEILATSDIFWDEVADIEIEHSEEYVYDLTVDGCHNFVANGIIVHNSELLQYVARELAPRGIYASGKSASGAGLTAAAIKDEFGDGGWSIEAGALVLADMGTACIDEFEKMEETDRAAMHETLEQQQVSVAKAGILATFRARCSILAAANPKYGRFDKYRAISEQVNLTPTILSRFDLIFFVEDKLEDTRQVAKHILDTAITPQAITSPVPSEFLKKYIAYARQNCSPTLSPDARERIESFYVDMREAANKQEDMPIPMTARQLWAIIRLARASARVRLSDSAAVEDVERAIGLVNFSLKQAGMDIEAGKVDIDKIMVGVTKSQRDRINEIIRIIRELEREFETARKSEVIQRCSEKGISERDVEELLEKLKRDGNIYEPKHGNYKVV